MVSINLNSDTLKEPEKEYEKIQIEPEQREIIDQLTHVLSTHIPLSKLSMRGLVAIAFREFQKTHHIHISNIATASPERRIESVDALQSILLKHLIEILESKTDIAQIKVAMEDTFAYYKDHFAYR